MRHTILLLLAMSINSFAAPAITQELLFTQADGSQFKGRLKGDEYFHWQESLSGDILIYDRDTKNYDYAVLRKINGKYNLVSSTDKYDRDKKNVRTSDKYNIDKKILSSIWKRRRIEGKR